MDDDRKTIGAPYREAPLAPAIVSPTPRITVRDEEDELLIEVRGPRGANWLAMALLSAVLVAMFFSADSEAALAVLFAYAAWFVFSAVRHAMTVTSLKVRRGELLIERCGPLHRAQRRISLAEIDLTKADMYLEAEEDCFRLLLPLKGRPRSEGVRVLDDNSEEHLAWVAKVLSTRMRALAADAP